ncbi:putative thiamine pyrophosphate enzyme [Rhodococcus wratislaviensis NBRC 100605]|uniref:acetolactate synthase n=2 Tax=Rhodococcus wratislaviensis TaxID=44752 RepID=X0R9D9_RHOWR|nr:putative thiamine pyrophosphate enzyme [Rhodococcus wratislaviensis NBRC 100605]
MRASQAVAEVLRREGIEYAFCIPSNKLIDSVAEVGIRPIVGRHERSTINMADAYSRITNGEKIGVALVQQGPGAEAAFGAIAQAYSDSVPLLFLPQGDPRKAHGLRTSFDAVEAFKPISKWSARLDNPATIHDQLRRAFQLMRSGRPGPVLLELPIDVADEEVDESLFAYEPPARYLSAANHADVVRAVDILMQAERPLIRAGHGVLWAGATDELVEFAELLGAPVATTYVAKSAFPENHPLSIGTGGTGVSAGIRAFVPDADVIFSIGASLLNTLASFHIPAGRTIIQSTNDPDDLSLQYPIASGLVGDAKLVLSQVTEELRRRLGSAKPVSAARDARAEVAAVAEQTREEWAERFATDEVPISPLRLVSEMINALDPDKSIVTHDSGYPRDHLAPHYVSTRPRGYLGWGNSTPLGSSLGLALGAAVAAPGKISVCFLGDAAIGQCAVEIETAVRNKIPVLIVLTNNSEMTGYGHHHPIAQERFGHKELSGNFAEIGTALGAVSYKVTDPGEVGPALRKAIAEVEGGATVLLEVITSALRHRYPAVDVIPN